MAEELSFDVVNQILLGLDVEDLLRCKSVCKSWQSLISSPRFVKAHLNRSYNSDHNNPEMGHRRFFFSLTYYNTYHIVGSCNGLVCVSHIYVVFVISNPSTLEQRELPTPPPYRPPTDGPSNIRDVVCWGFGYDSLADDYKVVAGFYSKKSGLTLFYVLALKSNIWKVIGEVKYKCLDGILCGGALYWLMRGADNKAILIALDLSTDEFKEIPLPTTDEEYEWNEGHSLGVIDERLCIYLSCFPSPLPLSTKKWVMKNNKWELYNDNHCETKYDVAYRLETIRDQEERFYNHDYGRRVPSNGEYLHFSIFFKSLVSPHPHLNNKNNNNYDGQQRNVKRKQGKEDNKSVESGDTRKRKRKRKRTRKHKRQI